jgi:hypothetical protein
MGLTHASASHLMICSRLRFPGMSFSYPPSGTNGLAKTYPFNDDSRIARVCLPIGTYAFHDSVYAQVCLTDMPLDKASHILKPKG